MSWDTADHLLCKHDDPGGNLNHLKNIVPKKCFCKIKTFSDLPTFKIFGDRKHTYFSLALTNKSRVTVVHFLEMQK